MKVQAIIPAAGSGSRMAGKKSKLLLTLADKPLIVHTLQAFEDCDIIESVILVVPRDLAETYKTIVEECGLKKVKEFIAGGKSRCESISNALSYLGPDADLVVVHDGARPVVSVDLIKRAVQKCKNEKAVVAAVRVKPTIKQVHRDDGLVERTLKRDDLYEIQTPQVFKKSILLEAYEQAASLDATDDASLVEQIGFPVKIIEGEYRNIKVTTEEDLLVAETFLKNRPA